MRSIEDGPLCTRWGDGSYPLSEREFKMLKEPLWAPDASFAIVASAPVEEVHEGGQAEIFYVDGPPSMPLTKFAKQMKWGS